MSSKSRLLLILALVSGAFVVSLIGDTSTSPVQFEQSLTVQWDGQKQGGPKLDWRKYEYGLRSDGVLVWRLRTTKR